MSKFRDNKIRKFAQISFSDKYLTGRKHCTDCKRWRHVLDFTVHTWLDAEKTIPNKLLSNCKFCAAKRQRKRTGYKPRNWYRLGRRGTQLERCNRNAERRAKYLILRCDPKWVQARREYQRKHGKTDPKLTRWYSHSGQFSASEFVNFLNPKLIPSERGIKALFINGKRLTHSEVRMLYAWRTGQYKTVRLGTADAWAIRFDLPFWEIEEHKLV